MVLIGGLQKETGRGIMRYCGREGVVWGLFGVLVEGLDEYPTLVRFCITPLIW